MSRLTLVAPATVTLVDIPSERVKDMSLVFMLPGIACIGKSTNPDVSMQIMDTLFDFVSPETKKMSTEHHKVGKFSMTSIGKIPEFVALKDVFAASNNTHLLLKIAASHADNHEDASLNRDMLETVISHINYADYSFMASDSKTLWVMEDGGGLFALDCRKTIGQIFISGSSDGLKKIIKEHRKFIPEDSAGMIVIPKSQLWKFTWSDDKWTISKHRVSKTKYYDYTAKSAGVVIPESEVNKAKSKSEFSDVE